MDGRSRRWMVPLALVLALAATACGGEPLFQDVGEASQRWVHGGTTTTLASGGDDGGVAAPPGGIAVTELAWINDGAGDAAIGRDPAAVITGVWNRGGGVERFIQASREEIAVALPELRFPAAVPDEVGWVTSQLVFDVASGTLDVGVSAQFGLWRAEPYTVERTEGQLAVFRVGQVAPGTADVEVRSDQVEEGLTLSWVRSPYHYELFCRTGLDEARCWSMAESTTALFGLLEG